MMAEQIKEMVELDLKKSIIGKWWDESYMNKFFMKNPPKKLHPSFDYPENEKFKFEKKIIQLDKGNSGGHSYLRNSEN